jgi:hypothetical protein
MCFADGQRVPAAISTDQFNKMLDNGNRDDE